MYAPNPSDIQVKEFRDQEMLANAARYRLLSEARESSEPQLRPRGLRRVTLTVSYARYLVSLLASVAFATTTK
jgi:hypothetical protein